MPFETVMYPPTQWNKSDSYERELVLQILKLLLDSLQFYSSHINGKVIIKYVQGFILPFDYYSKISDQVITRQ